MRYIVKETVDGRYVGSYNTIVDAANKGCEGLSPENLRYYIKTGKELNGFIFKYAEDPIDKAIMDQYMSDPYNKPLNLVRRDMEALSDTIDACVSKDLPKAECDIVDAVPELLKPINVLIIGDLHEPFSREGYLEFCKSIYDKYNCNRVVFIGDILDFHFSSFHETDADGHSAAEELRLAKINIDKWYNVFPVAKVCHGNHDLIPIRRAFNSGLSSTWIKSISEILNTPNWEYVEDFVISDVLYTHGVGRKAEARMKNDMTSVVQGHYHSEGYIAYSVGRKTKNFAMQVGCGVHDKSYAMAYGKHFNKMHISCGVVLNNGTLPILEYMDL